jgi:hypothetical protein
LKTSQAHLPMMSATKPGLAPLTAGLRHDDMRHSHRAGRPIGTRFERRWGSAVVAIDGNLFARQCDIESISVRARMVLASEDYPWSSDRVNAPGAADSVIPRHPLHPDLLAEDEVQRQMSPRRFADVVTHDQIQGLSLRSLVGHQKTL